MQINNIYDCHVHSCFSADGIATMREMCEEAIRKSLRGIAFTDHIDTEKREHLNDLAIRKRYVEEIYALKRYYSPALDVICSYELSSPHKESLITERLYDECFDYRMISVHHGAMEIPLKNKKEYIKSYLMEAESAVCSGEYHVLGHIDLLRRFYGNFFFEESQLQALYVTMIEKNMALEINSHSFKKKASISREDLAYVEEWKICGGKHIVLGSDAHSCENVAIRFEEILHYLPQGLEIGHFAKGSFVIDKIS